MAGEILVILVQSTGPGIQRFLVDPCSATVHQGTLHFSDAICVLKYDGEEDDDGGVTRELDQWLRAHWLSLERTQVQFLELTGQVTIFCNSSYRRSDGPFWLPGIPGTQVEYIQVGKTLIKIK